MKEEIDVPKGFNPHERQHIADALMEHGRELFSKYGLQKTSISELTKMVGISQGSFYKFYDSKEALYFEILEKEEEAIKEQFLRVSLKGGNDPKKVLKGLLLQTIDEIERNPFIRQLYVENNRESMLRKLPPEKLEEHFKNDSMTLMPLIEKWQAEGVIVRKDPELLAGLFRSLFVLTLHEKEIGESVFRETLESYVTFLVESIVDEGK
jgi:AcrR family transcriptional regulator